jgi:hypothetical protein
MIKKAHNTVGGLGIYGILEGATNSEAEKNLITNYMRVSKRAGKYAEACWHMTRQTTYGVVLVIVNNNPQATVLRRGDKTTNHQYRPVRWHFMNEMMERKQKGLHSIH